MPSRKRSKKPSKKVELPDYARSGRLLSIEQSRAFLNISRTQFYRIRKNKDFPPSYRFGKKRQYKYDELEWYLQKIKE